MNTAIYKICKAGKIGMFWDFGKRGKLYKGKAK